METGNPPAAHFVIFLLGNLAPHSGHSSQPVLRAYDGVEDNF